MKQPYMNPNSGKVKLPDGRIVSQRVYQEILAEEEAKQKRRDALLAEATEASKVYTAELERIKSLVYTGSTGSITIQGNITAEAGVSQIAIKSVTGSGAFEGIVMDEAKPFFDAVNDMFKKIMADINTAGAKMREIEQRMNEEMGINQEQQKPEQIQVDTNKESTVDLVVQTIGEQEKAEANNKKIAESAPTGSAKAAA